MNSSVIRRESRRRIKLSAGRRDKIKKYIFNPSKISISSNSIK
jgi:hypothetical protein